MQVCRNKNSASLYNESEGSALGKTVLFDLAIISFLRERMSKHVVVYICPIKVSYETEDLILGKETEAQAGSMQ